MKTRHNSTSKEFVIKRAFRIGRVLRQDLIRAFGMTTATATRALTDALDSCPSMIERRGKTVYPKPGVGVPDFANESNLLSELEAGKNEPQETGIFEEELPISYVSWTNSSPPEPGTLFRILEAIRTNSLLVIVYVGTKKGEVPRERTILPLALERMNDQWRIIAQDIQKTVSKDSGKKIWEAPLRTFVLSRILASAWYRGPRPKGILRLGHWDEIRKVRVATNPLYNDAQKKVLERELKIKNGIVEIPARSIFEFRRRFMDAPSTPDAIWPPLIEKEP